MEKSSEQGRGGGVIASENWKWPLRLSSSSDSSTASLMSGHQAPAWTLPVMKSSLLGKTHRSIVSS